MLATASHSLAIVGHLVLHLGHAVEELHAQTAAVVPQLELLHRCPQPHVGAAAQAGRTRMLSTRSFAASWSLTAPATVSWPPTPGTNGEQIRTSAACGECARHAASGVNRFASDSKPCGGCRYRPVHDPCECRHRGRPVAGPDGRLPGARRRARTSWRNECTACGARFFDRRNACANVLRHRVPQGRRSPTEGELRAFTIVAFAAPGHPGAVRRRRSSTATARACAANVDQRRARPRARARSA